MTNTFGVNIIPDNDAERINVLRRYQVLETPPEDAFNNVAKLATQIFNIPIALVSLVDKEQVFFKANVGMGKARVTDRGMSLCSLAIMQPEVTVFEDAPAETCLLANPLVAGEFGLKFYAGAPLITHDGYQIGTLCIIDKKPRPFTDNEKVILQNLAKIVMDELELRLSAIIEKQRQQQATEEVAAINEELSAVNEELLQTQEHLLESHNNLLDSEALKDLAIEQSQLGIWHLDVNTRDFIPSVRLKEFFGYDAHEDMPYDAAVNQIREDYREKVIEEVNAAMQTGKPYDMEYPVVSYRNNVLRWVRATGRLNAADDNKKLYFSGTVLDITDRKQDELRKNDFIGMVSHELKTPLTSVKGYVQLLQAKAKKSEDSFAVNILDRANRQIEKMGTMINGFLNVSRLESGKIHINKQLLDMAVLIKETEEESLATITSHKIVFAPVERTIVMADRDKIGHVIGNLISNAVKYSPQGSIINVACVTINNNALVSIKDQGIGIAQKDIPKLFDRYYRVETDNVTSISGFGIGLYLCSEIIERHKGTINVESTPGKGSNFWFTLPVAAN